MLDVFKKPLVRIVSLLLILAVIIGFLSIRSCSKEKAVSAGKKVTEAQTGAVIETGKDAVDTVTNRVIITTRIDKITKEVARDITTIDDANKNDPVLKEISTTVPDNLQRAGIAGLCRYDVYTNNPRCVQ